MFRSKVVHLGLGRRTMFLRPLFQASRRGLSGVVSSRVRALTGTDRERIKEDLFVRTLNTDTVTGELLVNDAVQSAEAAEAEICPDKLDKAHKQMDAAMEDWRVELMAELDEMCVRKALPALSQEQKELLVSWNLTSE